MTEETEIEKKLEKEKDEEAIQESLGNIPTLEEVYEIYKKWLHIEDAKRLDAGFATVLTRKMQGTPVWMIFVGPSGDFKSEQLRALKNKNSVIIQRFTSKTLISGDRKVKQGDDFCNVFDAENEAVMLIYDMAQMLKLPTIEKAEVWAQLRDLYDGSLKREFGNRVSKSYENLRTTLIAGATPHIDAQILIHQDLGTRELIYRTEKVVDYDKIINMVLKNETSEELMKKELLEITQKFLQYKTPKDLTLTNEQIKKIRDLVEFLAQMRAQADTDSFSGEVRADVGPEMPTRCVKQLKRLFVALKSLKNDYPDERAFDVLKHIILSSSDQNRTKVYHYVRNNIVDYVGRKSTFQIAKEVKLGKKTTFKELSILNNLGLIYHEIEERDFGRVYDYWYYGKGNKQILNLEPLKHDMRKQELELRFEEENKLNQKLAKEETLERIWNNKDILVREALSRLESRMGKLIPIEELQKELEEKMSKDEIDDSIQKLKQTGDIFEPRRGYVQKV